MSRSEFGKTSSIVLLLGALLSPIPIGAAEDEAAFGTDRWTILGGEVVEHLGRESLKGTAILKEVEFENGVIEVDVAVDGSRSYPGVLFRRQSPADLERFYIRPHRGNGAFSDALQYTPVINGVAGWQLYSGEGYTAAATIPFDRWVRLKLEILGEQARVFIDGAEQPALKIHKLEHGKSKGGIGVMGPPDGSAYFSNFTYRADDDLDFDPPPPTVEPMGMVAEWELSPSYKFREIDTERTPRQQGVTDVSWETVQTAPDGLLDIARHRRRSPGEADFVWARAIIDAADAGVRPFRFGYSDTANVFLNGNLLFTGDSGYRSRSPGFSGIVGLNDTVHLQLNKGKNELLFLVGESFGGWALIGQFSDAVYRHEGLTRLWVIPRTFSYPESVVYDPARDVLYVSNFFSGGNEFISRVGLDGTVKDLRWVSGLRNPTGLCLAGDRLLVVERRTLTEIDVDSQEIAARHPIPDPGFPNDVACDSTGRVFVSDSGKSVIYRLDGDTFEVWLEDPRVVNPNGLYLDGDRLIVGCSGDGCIKSVSLSDKSIRTITCVGNGSIMDGVQGDGRGNYVVSDFNGRAFLVSPDGVRTDLLNTTPGEIYCADFEYIPDLDLMIVPTLNDNRLMGYSFDRDKTAGGAKP